jgi:hypothetical protein
VARALAHNLSKYVIRYQLPGCLNLTNLAPEVSFSSSNFSQHIAGRNHG